MSYILSQLGGGSTESEPLGPLMCFAGWRRALRLPAGASSSNLGAFLGDLRTLLSLPEAAFSEVAGAERLRFPEPETPIGLGGLDGSDDRGLSSLTLSSILMLSLSLPLLKFRNEFRVDLRFSGDRALTTLRVCCAILDVRIASATASRINNRSLLRLGLHVSFTTRLMASRTHQGDAVILLSLTKLYG